MAKVKKGPQKLTLLLVSSLTIMSVITISPSLPGMSLEFAEIKDARFIVQLVLTVPALFIALTSSMAGVLADRYGRMKLLWMALALYAFAGVSGYFLSDLYHILISRAVLGVAVGMSMTIVITLIADYFEGQERQQFTGLQVAFMSLGGILFLSLGGVLADISWRMPFLIYLFSLVVLPFSVLFLTEPPTPSRSGKSQTALKSPPIIWLLVFNTMFMWIMFFLIPVKLPFHLLDIGVEKNALIGIAIAVSTAFSAISSFYYSRIKGRYSFYSIFFIGYLLMAVGFALIAWAKNYEVVLIAMMFAGLGLGIMIPNTNLWVMKIAPPEIRGREIGKLTTFWFFGQFLSPIITLPLSKIWDLSTLFMLVSALMFMLSIFFVSLHFRNTIKDLNALKQ